MVHICIWLIPTTTLASPAITPNLPHLCFLDFLLRVVRDPGGNDRSEVLYYIARLYLFVIYKDIVLINNLDRQLLPHLHPSNHALLQSPYSLSYYKLRQKKPIRPGMKFAIEFFYIQGTCLSP